MSQSDKLILLFLIISGAANCAGYAVKKNPFSLFIGITNLMLALALLSGRF